MEKNKIIQVSTFRPEKCGIACWTEDLINYCHAEDPSLRNRVFAINGYRKTNEYSDFVDFCMERNSLKDYFKAADLINEDSRVGIASIQHEFGIFGGKMGEYIINFIDSVKKPNLVTLHTVPREKEADERTIKRKEVLKEIIPKTDQIIVISNTAKNILIKEYDADPDKLNVILHGVHSFKETTEESKKILGLDGKFVLSTPGLLREKRGLEYVIKALPSIVKKNPNFIYIVAGESHPREVKGDKEPYRELLMKEVENAGLEKNVIFINKYLSLNSLLRYIQASDLCITPYTFSGQISSGILSYCVGLDKPVISTPFLYAQELLGEDRGIVLPDFNNPESISVAIEEAIGNSDKMKKIKRNIQPIKKKLMWSNVAKEYIKVEKKLMI